MKEPEAKGATKEGAGEEGAGEEGTVAGGATNAEAARAAFEEDFAWLRRALHDLCQPLTALECLLYVNREPVQGESIDATSMRHVMDEGLIECSRMIVLVRAMQRRLSPGNKEP